MTPSSPYKASPNPQPMVGEVQRGEKGEVLGPEPFFQLGDRVRSRGMRKLVGTVARVSAEHTKVTSTEKMWLEFLVVALDEESRHSGLTQDYHVLAQHYDLVSR